MGKISLILACIKSIAQERIEGHADFCLYGLQKPCCKNTRENVFHPSLI